MNNFYELISKRRSYRKFSSAPLLPEQVEMILKAGLKSPSSKNAKPWHFIVIEDKAILKKLAFCKKLGAKFISDCSLAIIVTGDPLISSVWIEDAAIATTIMQLQAEDLGLASCWIQIRNRYTEGEIPSEEFIKDLLNIPLQLQVLSIIALGNKVEEKNTIGDDELKWEKVHIGKF